MKPNLAKNTLQNTDKSTNNNVNDTKQTPHPVNHFQRTGRLQKNIKKQQVIQTSSTNSNSQISQLQQNKPYVYTPLTRTLKPNPSNKSLNSAQKVVEQKKQQVVKSTNPSFIKTSQIPMQIAKKQVVSPVKVFDPFQKSVYTPKAKQINKQVTSPNKNQTKNQINQSIIPPLLSTPTSIGNNNKSNIQNKISQVTQVKELSVPLQTQIIKKDVKTLSKKIQNQTPQKQQKTQTKKEVASNQQILMPKIVLVKSKMVVFVMTKCYLNKLKQSWFNLKSNFLKKGKVNNLAAILAFEINLVIQKNNKNFQNFAFDKLKSINAKKVKQQFKNQDLIRNHLNSNKNVFMCNSIERIFKSQMKSCFEKLIKSIQLKKNVYKAAIAWNNIQKKKLRQFFNIFVSKAKIQVGKKTFLLQKLSQIYKKTVLNVLEASFRTLLNAKTNVSIPKECKTDRSFISKLSIKTVQPKLAQQNVELPMNNDELKAKKIELQNQIKKLRNQKIQQQRSLKESIKTIKDQNEEKLKESIKVKECNAGLKKKIQTTTHKFLEQLSQLSTQQNKQSEPTLRRIHQIYMEFYKMTEQQIKSNIQSLCTLYKIDQGNFNKIVIEWLTIHKNQSLKKQIDQYQNNEYIISQTSKISLQQGDILKKFIKSYTKERYMWEQVKDYIAEALQ